MKGYYNNEFDPTKQTPFILLRFCIYHEYKQIQISNIFLPKFMQYKGQGKRLIYEIFEIAEENSYGLFLVDMVPSFYKRMLDKGALPCNECDDAVQIVRETKLC